MAAIGMLLAGPVLKLMGTPAAPPAEGGLPHR